MNIIHLYYKILESLDTVNTARFDFGQIGRSVNTGIDNIVNDRYAPLKDKPYSFQRVQRVRDELSPLVKPSAELTPGSNNTFSLSSVIDYRFMLSSEAKINNKWINAVPITYDSEPEIDKSPFTRPTITVIPERVYRIESSDGIRIKYGTVGVLTNLKFYYLKNPNVVSFGIQADAGDTIIRGKTIIALFDSIITVGPSSVPLKIGESYLLTNANGIVQSGSVLYDYVETDLPATLHEEVARNAAYELAVSIQNYELAKFIMSQDVNLK